MGMGKIIRQIEKEIIQQRADEQRILNEITAATSLDFAERAAGTLDPKKHLYSFETYLTLLDGLKILIYAGVPSDLSLESIQCGYSTGEILARYNIANSQP